MCCKYATDAEVGYGKSWDMFCAYVWPLDLLQNVKRCLHWVILKILTKLKTQALTKSLNVDIWEVGTSNQLIKKGSYTNIKFSKKKLFTGKTSTFVIVHFALPPVFWKRFLFFWKVKYWKRSKFPVVLS